MNEKIIHFIEGQKNSTICTSVNNMPLCANCFYAYLKEDNYLVFKSNRETKHMTNALINNNMAGTIIPDIGKVGVIRGIQFTGKLVIPMNDLLEKMKKVYYTKFPFALTMTGEIWAIELLSIKMTDNTLGFGKKIIWEKSPSL